MCSCADEPGSVLPNNVQQLYSGFLLHYKAKWFASNWSRVFGVLYQDSTFVWYESQMASRPEGIIYLKLAPELIAVGQYSRRLFQVPILPSNGPVIENLIAFGERRKQRVYFFLPESQQEFNAWWTGIVSTLPVAAASTGPSFPTMAPPLQPINDKSLGIGPPPAPAYSPAYYPPGYVVHQQQPAAPSTNTVIVRDSGPSYGGAAVGLAAGVVMGAAISDLAHPGYGYGGGWGGYGGYHQENDVTVVNNYNVDYNNVQGFSTNDTDTANYDDYDGGYDY